MTVQLGAAFGPRVPFPPVAVDEDAVRDEQLLAAITRLTDTLLAQAVEEDSEEADDAAEEAAESSVEETSEMGDAPEFPSADEIGAAIARYLPVDDDGPILDALKDLKDALEKTASSPIRFGSGGGGLGGATFDSTGALKVSSTGGATGGLTDTQLRAIPVPVSGTISNGQSQPLTDAQLRATAVAVSNASLPLPIGAAKDSTLTDGTQRLGGTVAVSNIALTNQAGTYDYRAGTSGSPRAFTGRVLGIAAHASSAASFTINGGDPIPVPTGAGISLTPFGNLTSPTLVFTGTDSYSVEFVS